MKTKILFSSLLCGFLVACGGGSRASSTPAVAPTDGTTCDFSSMTSLESASYDFGANFLDEFTQSSRWESENADITLVNGKGQLTANSTDTSNALEAWKLYKKQMPYDKSWEISVKVDIPLYWNSNGGDEAQVGAGIFVGKPVTSGQSSKVYECNMATVNGGERFAQAQLVANRLGDDPIDVQHTTLSNNTQTATLKITFCANTKTLTLYIDDKIVGKGQKINSEGMDNWGIKSSGMLDVGIMGFAENTVITSNQPTLDDFSYTIYK